VTFTQKATEELRQRIRDYLHLFLEELKDPKGKDPFLQSFINKYQANQDTAFILREAIVNFDQAAIFTIHGFCQRLLADNAFESSVAFETELITDQAEMLTEISNDYWRQKFYAAPSFLAEYIIAKGYRPEYFLNYGLKALKGVNFKIIPDHFEEDFSSLEAEHQKIKKDFQEIKENWHQSEDEIKGILLEIDRPDWVESRVNKLNNYFQADDPLANFKEFSFFSSSYFNKKNKKVELNFFDLVESFIKARDKILQRIDRFFLNLKIKFFLYLEEEFRLRKETKNIQTYDDLLKKTEQALLPKNNFSLGQIIRQQYPVVLIDEFQDTDSSQDRIFKNIYKKEDVLIFVGDPKQAIYRFRGADIYTYLQAAGEVENKYTLKVNWRSSYKFIKGLNTIFSNGPHPFVFEQIKFDLAQGNDQGQPSGISFADQEIAPFQVCFLDKDNKSWSKGEASKLVARLTALEILKLIKGGKKGTSKIGEANILPQDIAILVRKNEQAYLVKQELDQLKISSVLYSNKSIFASLEAQDLERVLKAIINFRDKRLIKKALLTSIFSYSGDQLYEAQNKKEIWGKILKEFQEYYQIWSRYSFIRMFNKLKKESELVVNLFSLGQGERRLTNYIHLAEILQGVEIQAKITPDSLLKWLGEKIKLEFKAEEDQLRLEKDEMAIKIITVHKSKGLEYPVVFCPFIWDSAAVEKEGFFFHDSKKDNGLTLDLGSGQENNLQQARQETLAEDVRLFYVALTRAKYACYLFWGKIKEAEFSAPAYIFSQDQSEFHPEKFKEKSEDDWRKDLEVLEKNSEGSLKIFLASEKVKFFKKDNFLSPLFSAPKLRKREFKGKIEQDWLIASYSSLISKKISYSSQGQTNFFSYQEDEAKRNFAENIFTFPKGSLAGTCLHSILEEIDFSSKDYTFFQRVIRENLDKYNFEEQKWTPVLEEMLDNLLNLELDKKSGLALNKIDHSKRLTELEFYFPLSRITSNGLANIFSQSKINFAGGEIFSKLSELEFTSFQGFLRGFIDLVFCYQERFYLLDWKSNFLGNKLEDYNQNSLQEAMKDHYYFLQSYFYTVALNQFLKVREKGYDYRSHFGGIYYIFLRGIDQQAGPQFGVHFDLPDYNFIDNLTKFLVPE